MKKLLLVLLGLTACAPNPNNLVSEQPPADNRERLVVFGDSVSYCQQCFPTLIAGALHMRIDNRAEPGTPAATQLKAIMAYVPQPGDTIIYLTGYNDLRGQGLAHLAQYRAELRQALVHLSVYNQPVYIGTTQAPLCVDGPSQAANGLGCAPGAAQAYEQAILDEVANINKQNIRSVYTNAHWVPSYNNLYDMVHTSPLGAAQLATIFLEQMQ